MRLSLVALGAVLGTAFLLHSIFNLIRLGYCFSPSCSAQQLTDSSNSISNHVPIGQCRATSVLLARGSSRSVRDKILLLGQKNSLSEYILPVMHLSKYDPTLSDPSYARQGLSAVKYGYPITIGSSKLRLALFHLGLADAIILTHDKASNSIDPLNIKYQFRLQPFKIRLSLPEISQNVGISEDSEVVEKYIIRNPSLLNPHLYSCP